MKTLVIHPTDSSTDFLKPIYEAIPKKNKTVITTGLDFNELADLIEKHDRVIMLGHGWTMGLFNVSEFETGGLVIDWKLADLLREKSENIFIWCRAHVFVETHNLKGFNSDMFISEVGESALLSREPYYLSRNLATQEQIDESNNGFVNIIKKYINKDVETIYKKTTKQYSVLAKNNPVARYNYERLYLSK